MRHLDEPLLNEYLDEVLDEPTRRSVDAHLDACPECRARLDDLRMVFASLSLVGEQPLAHDLTPGVLGHLPGTLSLGRRLALAVQAGVAMGLLGAIGQGVLSVARPLINMRLLTHVWINLAGKVSLRLPAVDIPSLDLSGYSLPLSTPVTVILLVTVVFLWGLGNARLLQNGNGNYR